MAHPPLPPFPATLDLIEEQAESHYQCLKAANSDMADRYNDPVFLSTDEQTREQARTNWAASLTNGDLSSILPRVSELYKRDSIVAAMLWEILMRLNTRKSHVPKKATTARNCYLVTPDPSPNQA